MRRTPAAALFTVALALGAAFPAPEADADEPRQIRECRTIDEPGSYALVRNLTARGDCLIIAADFVTLDLNGWTITGDGTGFGIRTDPLDPFDDFVEDLEDPEDFEEPEDLEDPLDPQRRGSVVRNGTVAGFDDGVVLAPPFVAPDSIVEGVRAIGNTRIGIFARGIVSGNTASDNRVAGITGFGVVSGNTAGDNLGHGIIGQGVVSGNTAVGNGAGGDICEVGEPCAGIVVLNGSTASGNTAAGNRGIGIDVVCPSNVIGNTAVFSTEQNLRLRDPRLEGCNTFQNLAP